MVDENIVRTGIDGLDELLKGGLIRNRSILVEGDPGTGKSTLGMQFLINGALQYDEPGVLLLLEYDLADLISDFRVYDWDILDLIDSKKLAVVSPPGGLENPDQLSLDDILNLVHRATLRINARRIVIDSLNSIELAMLSNRNLRKELIRFISLLRDLDCTVLLLSESQNSSTDQVYNYLTHGVISLYNIKAGAQRLRAIEIQKMRGIDHSTLTHSMNIQSGKGIIVLPHEIDLSEL
ncbi:MAG: hypothetical protein IH840_04150 [Candidatus Heimdallarchaeota archaeon]|nr:hypothetical protein [Candidatus Heimdallarchaeota archaeon]